MTFNNCREKCFPKNSVFSRQKREILYFVTVFFSSIHFLRYITVIVGLFSSSEITRLTLFSTFWAETKNLSLGRHRSSFVGRKL